MQKQNTDRKDAFNILCDIQKRVIAIEMRLGVVQPQIEVARVSLIDRIRKIMSDGEMHFTLEISQKLNLTPLQISGVFCQLVKRGEIKRLQRNTYQNTKVQENRIASALADFRE